MSTAHVLDDRIVQALYEAAVGLTSWHVPLAGLFEVIGLRSMQLVFVDRRTGKLLASEQPIALFDDGAVQGTLDHIREWSRVDPHIEATITLPVGKLYNSEADGAHIRHGEEPFYREYFHAYGNRGVLSCKVEESDDHMALIGLVRSTWHPQFGVADEDVFLRYCRHLTAALTIGRYVARLRHEAMAGKSLIEGAGKPMVLIDGDFGIRASNASGRAIMGLGSVLADRDGRLVATHAQDEDKLREALARLQADGVRSRTALRLGPLGDRSLLCSLWHVRPQETMSAFGSEPAFLLSVLPRQPGATVEPAYLEALFDLTPAEARVTIALQGGESAQAVAQSRRVSIETVRSQVRSIYTKTGANTRAELARLVAHVQRL